MTRVVLVAFLIFAPLAAVAQPIGPDVLGGSPEASVRLEEISGDLEQRFEDAMARYDAEIAEQPHRIRAQLARCEFVEAFASEYEYVSFSDELYERSEQCAEDLRARFSDHPELRLWQLGRIYGDEEILETGQSLLNVIDVHGWTSGQRGRLYTLLASASERLDTEGRLRGRTADYARRALEYDVRADVRLILAAYFHETGDRAAAFEQLTSPFDGHDPEDNSYVVRKMAYLGELAEHDAVLALHAQLDDSGYYDRTAAAAALRAVGELELARGELEDDAAAYYGTEDERQRFALALEAGDADAALAAYESWRDAGFWEDPIGINRFALFLAHPELPWRARDALGLLGGMVYLALLCALWCVPLGLIHYRGLVNRQRSATPYDHGGLQLRHAWWGLSAFMLASFLSLYAAGPMDVFADTTTPWAIAAEQPQLARMLLVESVVAVVLLAFVARALTAHFSQWWSTDWSIGKCVLIGAAVALFFRLPLVALLLAGMDLARVPLDNSVLQLLREIHVLYGPAAAIWVLSLAAPVAEEFIFRGLLLRASMRHVSFPLANTVQAALFSALHFDLTAAPYLFVCGLAFGLLARYSGGLLAPMVAHAIFNLVAGVLVTS
jgi:membrane protease YdiL (CAAX protease family)